MIYYLARLSIHANINKKYNEEMDGFLEYYVQNMSQIFIFLDTDI